MGLIFGSGEPVARLRRLLDVKGKVNLGLDETVVPVINLQDADQPPFRRTGVRWFFQASVAAVAGELGRVRIFHELAIDQLVDSIRVASAAALRYEIGQGPAGAAGGSAARTTEVMPIDNGGIISRSIGIRILTDSVTPSSLNFNFAEIRHGAGEEVEFRLPIVLPAKVDQPDPVTNAPTLTIECTTVNSIFVIGLSGLFWDSVPLSART